MTRDMGGMVYVVLLHEVGDDCEFFEQTPMRSAFGSVAFADFGTAESFGRWLHLMWSLDVSLLVVDLGTGEVVEELELSW